MGKQTTVQITVSQIVCFSLERKAQSVYLIHFNPLSVGLVVPKTLSKSVFNRFHLIVFILAAFRYKSILTKLYEIRMPPGQNAPFSSQLETLSFERLSTIRIKREKFFLKDYEIREHTRLWHILFICVLIVTLCECPKFDFLQNIEMKFRWAMNISVMKSKHSPILYGVLTHLINDH